MAMISGTMIESMVRENAQNICAGAIELLNSQPGIEPGEVPAVMMVVRPATEGQPPKLGLVRMALNADGTFRRAIELIDLLEFLTNARIGAAIQGMKEQAKLMERLEKVKEKLGKLSEEDKVGKKALALQAEAQELMEAIAKAKVSLLPPAQAALPATTTKELAPAADTTKA